MASANGPEHRARARDDRRRRAPGGRVADGGAARAYGAAARVRGKRRGGGAHRAARDRHQELPGAGEPVKLPRRDVVKELLRDRKDLLVVAGLGSTAWDITAAGDSPLSFPMWGAMGQAAMMGLGLALAQPARPGASTWRRLLPGAGSSTRSPPPRTWRRCASWSTARPVLTWRR